ncbi:hypothetical protein LIA77_06237 [Sarocladium implicatum]|nr:hypothetical protein LIA77_06237 [Sarocladium implicatum]
MIRIVRLLASREFLLFVAAALRPAISCSSVVACNASFQLVSPILLICHHSMQGLFLPIGRRSWSPALAPSPSHTRTLLPRCLLWLNSVCVCCPVAQFEASLRRPSFSRIRSRPLCVVARVRLSSHRQTPQAGGLRPTTQTTTSLKDGRRRCTLWAALVFSMPRLFTCKKILSSSRPTQPLLLEPQWEHGEPNKVSSIPTTHYNTRYPRPLRGAQRLLGRGKSHTPSSIGNPPHF